MFLERGHAYVYIAYGCWPMLNVASEALGVGAGVLVRALEPIEGIEAMRAIRGPRTAFRPRARARPGGGRDAGDARP